MIDHKILNDFLAKDDETLAEHTENLLEALKILKELNYIKDEWLYDLIKNACEYHDYGKINHRFQNRIKNRYKFDSKKEIGHNILSLFLIDPLRIIKDSDFSIIANAVLNHHHYVDNSKELDRLKKEDLLDYEIEELIKSLKKYDLNFEKKSLKNRPLGRIVNSIKKAKETKEGKLVLGFLHKCDYAASAHTTIEYSNNFLLENLNNIGYKWNKVQEYCLNHQSDNLIITAPTGEGKTEASLLWLGNNKGFYILPLKTAINSIYDRVKNNVLKNENIDERVALLHGDSLGMYINNQSDVDSVLEYHQRSKMLSMPITISTPDQLFIFVFQYPGYESMLATLSYSKVIIDEIQAYSPDLLAYLIYGLKQINNVGGKFAIFTATFPPFIRDLLKERNENDEKLEFQEKDFTDSKIKSNIRHNMKLEEIELTSEGIVNFYNSLKPNKSKKILVVCNTIKKAQEIFDEMEIKGFKNIYLLHSKFINKDRRLKEHQILETGKTYINENNKELNNKDEIWISTQIVEASLDIDFDYLFTELSDLNGLFQRFGRVNRKGVKEISSYNCFVYTEIDTNTLINKSETRGFIDRDIYDLSKNALIELKKSKNKESLEGYIISESEKVDLINNTLTTDNLKDSSFIKNYKRYYDYIRNRYEWETSLSETKKQFRNIISYQGIPKVIFDEYESEIRNIIFNISLIDEEYKEARSRDIKLSDKEKEELKIRKVELKNELKKFYISVGFYDIIKGQLEEIEIDQYEKVKIISGNYSYEKGFERIKGEKIDKNKEIEEVFDSFI